MTLSYQYLTMLSSDKPITKLIVENDPDKFYNSISNSLHHAFDATFKYVVFIFLMYMLISTIKWLLKYALFGPDVMGTVSVVHEHRNVETAVKKHKIDKDSLYYARRIDNLLANANDERGAIEALSAQLKKLHEQKQEYIGHAKEQVEKQFKSIEKYILMFEKLQADRKMTSLNNHSKHVLDDVWD